MRYVVDASVAIKWYVPEIFEAEASRVLDAGAELHAPELIVPEFAISFGKRCVRVNFRKRSDRKYFQRSENVR